MKRGQSFARWSKRVGVAFASATGLLLVYLAGLQATGNFHPVVQGEVYRSAQPSREQLSRYVRQHGIRTVINLRGANVGDDWYDDEISESRRLGVSHVDFRMSASRELSQEQAAALIRILAEADKPVLIHCKSGSDRTGLASALYMSSVAHRGEEAAEAQISLAFGHIPLAISPPYAMDRTFEALEPWLGFGES